MRVDDDSKELWRLLLVGQRRLTDRFMARIKADFGLSTAQFEALMVLRGVSGGRLSMSRLSRSLLYSSGSATHLVDRLVQLGHVERHAGAHDGRSVDVALTAAGRDLIERARAAHHEDLERDFAPLVDPEELPVLLGFAKRLAATQRG